MSDDDAPREPRTEDERRALRIALWLNVGLSVSLFTAGLLADSSGLIANALDNTSDAVVYAISLYAVSRGAQWKTRAATLSGVMLLVLAASVLADVARRFVAGAEPVGGIIIGMTVVAVVVNVASLRVLHSTRGADVNLRAAWTFSINDLVSNLGVLVAGILVLWLGRSWPDLVVGLLIALVAARGGIEILADARRTRRAVTP